VEKPEQPQSLTVSVIEAARLLGVGKAAAYGAIHRGEIPAIRIGRLLRVPRKALEQMLERTGK
jgi:excisionase family DNA binding protein